MEAPTIDADTLTFAVREPDFTTASRAAQAINTFLGAPAAKAVDPGRVTVDVPDRFRTALPDLIAQLDDLTIESDVVARVVINERTGTVVVGGGVRLGPAAVAHGNLSVRISTRHQVSQPAPWGDVLHLWDFNRAAERDDHPDHALAKVLQYGFLAALPSLDPALLRQLIERGLAATGQAPLSAEHVQALAGLADPALPTEKVSDVESLLASRRLRVALGRIAAGYDGGLILK